MTSQIKLAGFWSGIFLAILGVAYLGFVAAMLAGGSGFPPVEPYQKMINLLVLITAVAMVIFWTVLHQAAPDNRKLFSRTSLGMILIFATLTSINRYVGLTVVRQSLASGNLSGLQWFMPYRWPSVMLALEFLAWGFFFGLACLLLAPVFTTGKLEQAISWTLVGTGVLSLLAALGQVAGVAALSFSPFTFAGVMAWGPGLTALAVLIAIWFRQAKGNG